MKIFLSNQTTLLLDKKIGAGAHGTVFLAHDLNTGEKFCVKQESSYERAAKEAAAISSFYDCKSEVIKVGNFYYFQQPFFPGKTLKTLMKEGLNTFEKLAIAEKLKDELNRLHEKGLLHRDLKTDNIMVNITNNEINVHIIDLGRSIRMDNHKDLKLRTNKICLFFQPQVAPEYLFGGEINKHSDIYSFGVIFKKLFPEDTELIGMIGNNPKKRLLTFEQVNTALKAIFENRKKIILEQCDYESHNTHSIEKRNELFKFKDTLTQTNYGDFSAMRKVQLSYEKIKVDFPEQKLRYFIELITSFLMTFGLRKPESVNPKDNMPFSP